MPNVTGPSAPMHPIWRPGFCAPRSRIDECARSGARRRTTIWGTWTPNLSSPLGIAHLSGPDGSIANHERPFDVRLEPRVVCDDDGCGAAAVQGHVQVVEQLASGG